MKSFWKNTSGPWGRDLVIRRKHIGDAGVKILGRHLVLAPMALNFFHDSYTDFFDFITLLERQSEDKKLLIDLGGVREVKAAAILVLYSTIEIIQKKTGDANRIKLTTCSQKRISIPLWKAGFWKLTNQEDLLPSYRNSGKGLEICTASCKATKSGDDSQLRKVIEYTQSMVLESGLDDEADLLAYNAITESVSNVWQHAYDESFFMGEVNDELAHWWIIVERIEDQFFIVVYDRGAGIPWTLQQKSWYHLAFVDAKGHVQYEIAMDALRIKMAVEYGSSRFKNDNRGKGLAEAKEFVQSNPMGTMLIFSGYGDYAFYSSTGKDELKKLPSNFNGTLIQWNLKLESKK
ncbi:hypothetical protein [Pseudomonas pergaminensis]|uniref:hypothetical protein n=1 Tax=Pseudomonas pergaminensis TaxID=2853159 RepID=UPI0034D7084C